MACDDFVSAKRGRGCTHVAITVYPTCLSAALSTQENGREAPLYLVHHFQNLNQASVCRAKGTGGDCNKRFSSSSFQDVWGRLATFIGDSVPEIKTKSKYNSTKPMNCTDSGCLIDFARQNLCVIHVCGSRRSRCKILDRDTFVPCSLMGWCE